jgi:hypothetical protein
MSLSFPALGERGRLNWRRVSRWCRDTGGVDDPRLVLWHSFEPGVATFGLDGVITGLGLTAFGADFAGC